MRLSRSFLVLFLATLPATGCFETKDDDTGGSSGEGGDGGADGGADGGDGTGSDGTSGGGIDCDREPSTSAPDGACVTAELSCGDSRVFDMEGAGASRLDAADYSSGGWACWPVDLGTYTGGERFFRFDHPGNPDAPAMATITLESPCADLSLFAFWWESDSCPSGSASPYECEASIGSGSVQIWNNEPRSYLIGIEGEDAPSGPFRVRIDCEQ